LAEKIRIWDFYCIMSFMNAFILGSQDVFEYDRAYSLLTRELGKVVAIARSVRKPQSKLAGHLDAPHFSWVEVIATSKGWQITQALEQLAYARIRKNRDALKAVLQCSQFLNVFLPALVGSYEFQHIVGKQQGDEEKVFMLWGDFLDHMELYAEQLNETDFDFIRAQCVLRGLSLLGFLPDVAVCNSCGKQFSARGAYLADNQLVCDACAVSLRAGANSISYSVLKTIQQIMSGTWVLKDHYAKAVTRCADYFERQSEQFML